MQIRRALGVAAAGSILSCAALIAYPALTASAARPGTGAFSCLTASGTVTFSPPLSTTAKSKATIAFTASGCSGGGPTPSSVTAQGKYPFQPSECLRESPASGPGNLKLTYIPNVRASKIHGGMGFLSSDGLIVYLAPSSTMKGSYPSPPSLSILFAGVPVPACGTSLVNFSVSTQPLAGI